MESGYNGMDPIEFNQTVYNDELENNKLMFHAGLLREQAIKPQTSGKYLQRLATTV